MQTLVITIAQENGSGVPALVLIGLMVVVFYFLLIRPQQRRAKQQRELVAAIEPGDRVQTIGGMIGTVKEVMDDSIYLELAPGTTIELVKPAVQRRIHEFDDEDDADDG